MRIAIKIVACVFCVFFGYVARWYFGEVQPADQTIAMKWGDGKYGQNFYGAQVYLIPAGAGYSVHARVFIGPGNNFFHDCAEIGRATSVQDALDHFGTITWEEKGLVIGDPEAGGYHLPRKVFELHR